MSASKMDKRQKIPEPTVSRLPVYFRRLSELKQTGVTIVSSEEIAAQAGIKASQFRKDLSYFGEFGIQGLGYPVSHLLDRISAIMQLNKVHKMVLVGAGNLGAALANYPGFARWGFTLTEVYDADPRKVGRRLGHLTIKDAGELPKELDASIGMIAVPAQAARDVAQLLVDSGVNALLNFSGSQIFAPEHVVVRNVDLTHELAILNFFLLSGKA